MNATEKYNQRVKEVNSLLCVGLDSDMDKIPQSFLKAKLPQFAFNQWIIEQTHKDVSAYKPNAAFYEAGGTKGIEALKLTMEYLREKHPDIFTIVDAKRGDIGNTNAGYVSFVFDELGADAITLHPYLGKEALAPFLDRTDKTCIMLCRTSNPGAGELQDLLVGSEPLWKIIARKVAQEWNEKGNCMLVAGATYPEELAVIRSIVGEMTLLVPGIGAQGGDVEKTVKAGINAEKSGMIVNSSRGIIFAADPAGEAKNLKNEINSFR